MEGFLAFLKIVYGLFTAYKRLPKEFKPDFLVALLDGADTYLDRLEKSIDKAKYGRDPADLSKLLSNHRPTKLSDYN